MVYMLALLIPQCILSTNVAWMLEDLKGILWCQAHAVCLVSVSLVNATGTMFLN